MLRRLVEPLAYTALASSLIVGAYHAGKLKERQWWRSEIMQQSSRVQAAMSKMSQDADEFDATLVKMIGDQDASLASAENQVSTFKPAPADDGSCKPVPAHCLRRQGGGQAPARHAATGER